jgi:hypothetical protein
MPRCYTGRFTNGTHHMETAAVIAHRRDWFAAACAALVVLLVAGSLHASALPSDLDSLIFESDQIVEGRVVRAAATGSDLVEVTRIELGDLKLGQHIKVSNLFSHDKPGTGYWGASRDFLGASDDVLVFLKGPRDLSCVEAGMFLVVRGRVCRFGVERPPRYMGNWPTPRLSVYSPRLAELRSAIAASVGRRAGWRAHLEDPLVPAEVPWLLSTLRGRVIPRPSPFDEPDAIADAAAQRLAQLNDLQVDEQAIIADPSRSQFFATEFSSPQGQEYLLQRIANQQTPSADRRKLFAALVDPDGFHRAYFNYYDWPVVRLGLARLARLASQVAENDEASAGNILQVLESPLRTAAHDPSCTASVRADLNAAMDTLADLYRKSSTPDSVKFWIERGADAIGYSEYQRLHSPCGPIMTLAAPPDLSIYAASLPSSVLLTYAWRCAVPYANGRPPVLPPVTAAYLVLEPVADGSTYVLASPGMIGRAGAGGGGDCLSLPAGFPAGRYRLHYRLMSGNSVLSEGHGFETQIPQPGLRVFSSAAPLYRPPRLIWRRAWTDYLAPLGLVLVLLLLLKHFARSRRRVKWFRTGHCHQCGYDLRSSGKKCSECGTAVPAQLRVQKLRRRSLRFAGFTLVVAAAALAATWIRSYFVSDVIEYTSLLRADAAYSRRGSAVIQWFATGSDPGWNYDRLQPDELPGPIESIGASNVLSFLGIQWAPAMHRLLLPLWIPLLLVLFAGMALLWKGKPVMITPDHHNSAFQKAYEVVLRWASYPIRLRVT